MYPKIPNQKSKIGFYFHIPFCPHICSYCDFIKTNRFSAKDIKIYFQELLQSLNAWLVQFENNEFVQNSTYCTVYFGGGTPSLFDATFYEPLLVKLSEKFILEEVTIETNPFSNRKNFIGGYKDIGINRVTLGAQSLCADTLAILGRKHTKKTILDNIEWIRKEGLNQVQVDLIYGLKNMRTMSIDEEIKTLISAGATGISAYGLTLEPRTVLAQKKQYIVDDEQSVQEYELILKTCTELGLHQIETSNFSFEPAKHNQIYWYGYPYFGIGTGAHGLLPPILSFPSRDLMLSSRDVITGSKFDNAPYGIRYKVGVQPKERAPGNDDLKYATAEDRRLNFKTIFEPTRTRVDMIEELMFTLLRTEYGIPLDWLTTVLNDSNFIQTKLLAQAHIRRAVNEGKLFITKTHLALSPHEKIRGDAWALSLISIVL